MVKRTVKVLCTYSRVYLSHGQKLMVMLGKKQLAMLLSMLPHMIWLAVRGLVDTLTVIPKMTCGYQMEVSALSYFTQTGKAHLSAIAGGKSAHTA